jgi:anti-sigma factor (TIGR02949 family)
MDCRAVREHLVAFVAGRLAPEPRAELSRHLEECAACRRVADAENQLSAALDRLPRHVAPRALKRRLEELVAAAPAEVVDATGAAAAAGSPVNAGRAVAPFSRRSAWAPSLVSAFAAAALVLVVMRVTTPRPAAPHTATAEPAALIAEAVNDHLRVVGSTHPVEIESGGIHQVKPWFTGRLDFAPRVAFSGDADFPLIGGSVGYFRDRKAAVLVFKRRLHTITLLVFPADGLPWAGAGQQRLGRLTVTEEASRGFSVLLWRDGGLGYALVSDVSAPDLELLASRLNPE